MTDEFYFTLNHPQYNGILQLLIPKAFAGEPEAIYLLGEINMTHPQPSPRIWNRLWKFAAQNPDIEAIEHFKLSDSTICEWLPFTIEKALKLFFQASENNHSQSLLRIANFYHQGVILPRDPGKAFTYYTRAARVGNVVAIANLGHFYYLGKEVEKDVFKACACMQIASENGIEHAAALFNYFHSQLSRYERKKLALMVQKMLIDFGFIKNERGQL